MRIIFASQFSDNKKNHKKQKNMKTKFTQKDANNIHIKITKYEIAILRSNIRDCKNKIQEMQEQIKKYNEHLQQLKGL